MSKSNTPVKQIEEIEIDEDTPESDAEIISIKRGKLLKLTHHIERLRQQLNEENKEVNEEVVKWKNKTSKTTQTLVGELNDSIKWEES